MPLAHHGLTYVLASDFKVLLYIFQISHGTTTMAGTHLHVVEQALCTLRKMEQYISTGMESTSEIAMDIIEADLSLYITNTSVVNNGLEAYPCTPCAA